MTHSKCKGDRPMRKHSRTLPKAKLAAKPAAQRVWIGLDLGDRWSEMCVLDRRGTVRQRSRVRTTPAALREHFKPLVGAAVAIETGTHSPWVSRLLTECGLDVTVANAREVRKVHQSDRKNDRSDAEILARMLRFDRKLLAPIQHRSAAMQLDLAVLRARDALVRSRTLLINAVRGLVKSQGERIAPCSAGAFAQRVPASIPRPLKTAIEPVLETIEALTEQIRNYDAHIKALTIKRYPQTALLQQVQGVGPVTSLGFVLTLADKDRFRHSRDVGPYLGLVPRQRDSGDQQPQLRITKAGNAYMRRLLVGSGQYILGPFGPDCRLRRYGERLMQHGGKNAKKRAVVAVARKLAIVLHHLWSTGAVYDPFYGTATKRLAA
jgi:transposase